MSVAAVVQASGAKAPAKPRLFHEEIIDMILLEPAISQKEIAKRLGVTPQWVMILTNSDAFQRRFEERRKEMIDPHLRATLEDRMKGLVQQSIEVVMDRLAANPGDSATALKALDIGTRALGYGAKSQVNVTQNNTAFVVQAPEKSPNAASWADRYAPGPSGPATLVPSPAVGGHTSASGLLPFAEEPEDAAVLAELLSPPAGPAP